MSIKPLQPSRRDCIARELHRICANTLNIISRQCPDPEARHYSLSAKIQLTEQRGQAALLPLQHDARATQVALLAMVMCNPAAEW